jgi:hypothetical protein
VNSAQITPFMIDTVQDMPSLSDVEMLALNRNLSDNATL